MLIQRACIIQTKQMRAFAVRIAYPCFLLVAPRGAQVNHLSGSWTGRTQTSEILGLVELLHSVRAPRRVAILAML